jgi:RsbT co-antagonist protein rsbRD N-terminal domain
MKNTEAQPESAIGRLAAYVESHKDAMTNEWVARVRKDSAVPTDSMTKLEIIDHLPAIFDAISEALRQRRSDTTTKQLHETAARHTIVRWIEHYNLQAVVREISLLRTEFIYHLRVFEEEHPDFGIAPRLFASTTIHQILDDILIDATKTFLKLTEFRERSA